MQLVNYTKKEIRQTKEYPGFMEVEFEHQISSTKARLTYLGPKISPEMWHDILAFFKKVNDDMHSECQVRLFMHPDYGWDAWAFPQEARTGMSAREIQGKAFDDQRAQYPENEGWRYLGTVHSHCNSSAFQSGVDENNEQNQDGLHITVGKVSDAEHEIHARFYLAGGKFEPDMSLFWDIGDTARENLPAKYWDQVARYQMGKHPTGTVTFPPEWQANLIEIKPPIYPSGTVSFPVGGSGSSSSSFDGLGPTEKLLDLPLWRRKAVAGKRIMRFFASEGVPFHELCELVDDLKKSKLDSCIIDVAGTCNVDLSDIWQEIPHPNFEPHWYGELMEANGFDSLTGKKKKQHKGKATTTEVLGKETNHGVSVPIKTDTKDERKALDEHFGTEYY